MVWQYAWSATAPVFAWKGHRDQLSALAQNDNTFKDLGLRHRRGCTARRRVDGSMKAMGVREQPTKLLLLTLALLCLLASRAARADGPRAFVTSVSGTAKFSTWLDSGGAIGLAGADAVCVARASAASLPNAANYRAWLDSSFGDAFCRLHGLLGIRTQNCNGQLGTASIRGPWMRIDGQPFAEESRALFDSSAVFEPLLFDEFGASIEGFFDKVWTGRSPTNHCENWTSEDPDAVWAIVGCGTAVGPDWADCAFSPCSQVRPLICIEAAEGPPLTLPSGSGSLAFVTSATGGGRLESWPLGGGAFGLGAGDQICRLLASSARLPAPSSYFALLSVPGLSAFDRITSNGPFVRPDGVAFAASKASLIGNDATLLSGLNVTENGDLVSSSSTQVWTGTEVDGSPSQFNCQSWTLGTNIDDGAFGRPFRTTYEWMLHGWRDCDSALHLYCFSNEYLILWDNFERGDTSRWSEVHSGD